MFRETGIHLKITGTCINTSETIWFDHLGPWRNMAVADAVRISASFPFVFKPVLITQEPSLNRGTASGLLFADGGILNNLPIHAFNNVEVDNRVIKPEPVGFAESFFLEVPKDKEFSRGHLNRSVLAFRLGKREEQLRPSILGLDQYASAMYDTMFSLNETGNLLSGEEIKQTIELSTEGLSVLEFAIVDKIENKKVVTAKTRMKKIITRSYEETKKRIPKSV